MAGPEQLEVLRRHVERGLPCGAEAFIRRLERRAGQWLRARPRGRPKKEAPEIRCASLYFLYLYQPRKAPDPTTVGPVLVRIHYREAELRETVKAVGGQWRPQEKLWKLPYGTVINLGLDSRIIRFVMSNQV